VRILRLLSPLYSLANMALFVTYLLLERLFGTLKSKISRNECKKMDKNAKKIEKVSGPGLYK
jgi:hypothetical protein